MRDPFFSIIIPTYNSEGLIGRAISSITNQIFTDFEILIIDGLSEDKTIDIVKDTKDERIRILSEKDNGIYDAMNKGLEISKGTWIYFLGSDDALYDNEVLQKVYGAVLDSGLDIIYGNVMSDRYPGRVYDGEFSTEKIYHTNICHQAIFVKKAIFRITGPFNADYKYNADWDNNMKWLFNPSLKKQFADILICNYGAAGISTIVPDNIFLSDKEKNFMKYGRRYLSNEKKKSIYITIARRQKINSKYLAYIVTKLRIFFLSL